MGKQTKTEFFTELLKNCITDGTYPYGTALPPERELANQYHLNRTTVRIAIQTLANQGLLKKIQGKGTYVMLSPSFGMEERFRGMSELLQRYGYQPDSKILFTGTTAAGFKLGHLLNTGENTILYRIIRLRLGSGHPVSIENTFVPYGLIPGIEKMDFQIYSLYEVFAMNGLHIADIRQVFSSTRVRNSEAKYLGAKNGSAVASLDILSTSSQNQIIEYTNALILPEFCKLYADGAVLDSKLNIYAQSI